MKSKILAVILFLAPQFAWAEVLIQPVAGYEGRTCTAYLHVPENTEPSALLYYEWGTGIGSVANYIPIEETDLFSAGRMAILTVDKPGISPKNNTSNEAIVDHAAYDLYTTRERMECGKNALHWALSLNKFTTDRGIFFQGHSEGTQVVTYVYQLLLKTEPELVKKVRALILSGTVLDAEIDVINWQLDQEPPGFKEKFWDAYARKDDAFMLAWGEVAYVRFSSGINSPAMTTVYDDLASFHAPAAFEFFHGLNDMNLKVSSLEAYESANAQKIKDGKPGLSMQARYYQCAHSINPAGRKDIGNFVQGCLESAKAYCL
jgi:hypothetical protein